MLNNYKLGIEINPVDKSLNISAVFDFVKIVHHEGIAFYLNKNLTINEIKLNGDPIKLKRKRLPSTSRMSHAIKYSYEEKKIENYRDYMIEIKYSGFIDTIYQNDNYFCFSTHDFWIPIFEGFPQFMYLAAFYLPLDFNIILQGLPIQSEVRDEFKLSFWERDYMDFDIPVFLSRNLKEVKSDSSFEIYSVNPIPEEKIETLSKIISKIIEVFKNKFKFKINNVLKFVIVDQDMDISGKYFSTIFDEEIKPDNIKLLSKIIRTLLNISSEISEDSWILFGLVNYYLYIYLGEAKGERASNGVIEDWKTFLFSLSKMESLLNNKTSENINILLTKKAPYIFKMLETIFGKETFLNIISELLQKDTFNSMTTYEFIEYINQFSKNNLEHFLLQALHEREIPKIRINKHILTEPDGKIKFYGEIIQETSVPFEIPVIFDFEFKDGSTERRIHTLKKFKERYEFVFPTKPTKYLYNKDSEILIHIRS